MVLRPPSGDVAGGGFGGDNAAGTSAGSFGWNNDSTGSNAAASGESGASAGAAGGMMARYRAGVKDLHGPGGALGAPSPQGGTSDAEGNSENNRFARYPSIGFPGQSRNESVYYFNIG